LAARTSGEPVEHRHVSPAEVHEQLFAAGVVCRIGPRDAVAPST